MKLELYQILLILLFMHLILFIFRRIVQRFPGSTLSILFREYYRSDIRNMARIELLKSGRGHFIVAGACSVITIIGLLVNHYFNLSVIFLIALAIIPAALCFLFIVAGMYLYIRGYFRKE